MSMTRVSGMCVAAALLLPSPVSAAMLTVVEVGAPAVNCVFNASCSVIVSDSFGPIGLKNFSGQAGLQSRTYPGAAGTPAAGKTAYEYRIDLKQAFGATECTVGMVMDFGPVAKLPYKNNVPADIFVVTSGGLGNVGIKSAEQNGSVITFEFKQPLCADGVAPGAGNGTFFFGLAATGAPKASVVNFYGYGSPPFSQANARVPTH